MKLEALRKNFSQHCWTKRGLIGYMCAHCNMSSITPWGNCEPLAKKEQIMKCAMCKNSATLELKYQGKTYTICEEDMEHAVQSLDRDSILFQYRLINAKKWSSS